MRTTLFYALTITCLLASRHAMAQDSGYLQFVGHDFFNNNPLLNTEVKVMKAGSTYTTVNTGATKDFKLALPFGAVYDLYLYNRRAQTMYLRVLADSVPKKKYNLVSTYELNIPFFPRDSKSLDSTQFKNPFHRIYFNGKSKFVDDTVYMNAFLNKVYIRLPADTGAPVAIVQPQVGTLAGNINYDTKDKTPVQNRTVVLETKDGRQIATVKTTQNGTFVFQGIRLDEAYRLKVLFDDGSEVPLGQKILVSNSSHEVIESAAVSAAKQAVFESTVQHSMMRRLVDNVFAYKIAGKVASSNGVSNKIMADKYVYLLSEKNVLVQKVKTNALGVFLFTNIKPNLHYSIAVDDKDCDFSDNCRMVLFDTKDKRLRVIDSLTQNRFVYKFLAVSGAEFNSLLVDDIDVKMNVKGKVYGNNTNNPISDMKVMLLNDKYEPIDTAVTTSNGSFTFKHVSYSRQIIVSADNTAGVLEAFNNIMVYDNNDNLIKIVSVVKGGKFIYKPLATEQSRISELYVDDPWLALVDKSSYTAVNVQNKVIVENILFEFNKSAILPQASQTLDKAIMAMKLNPALTIELGAHTDSKGSDAYNLKLSEERAANARQYFIQNGIAADRIHAIGYGESKLLNHCGNKVLCPEEEHAANRRLEFRLTKK